MPSIVTNFKFKSNAPNFERDQLSYEELCAIGKGFDPKDNSIKINPFEWYDLGHIVYCPDRHRYYSFATKYDASSGELIKDEETGFFTVFDSGTGSNSDEYGNSAYRTVFAFTHSEETPKKPNGWKYDLIRQRAYPSILDENGNSKDGWFLDDSDLQPPVWMSIGEFNINFPDEEKWTTPVKVSGEDGRPGTDGTQLEFIYTRSYSEEDGPGYIPSNDINTDDYIPVEPWTDSTGVSHYWSDNAHGVDQTYQCEWMCQRYKYVHEDGTYHWGGWNEKMEDPKPILWSKYGVYGKDGDGIEYIYNLTHDNTPPILPPMSSDFIETNASRNNEGKVFQNDEYLPNGTFIIGEESIYVEGWTDDPGGTTPEEPFEWVSVRKFNRKTGKWGAFSDPVIWAHYGKEGFTSFVFCRTNETPGTPIDGSDTSYFNPIPIDPNKKVEWTDGIPAGKEMVWMSKKSFFNDHTDSQRGWSTPVQMTDTADFDVEFNDNDPYPGPPGEPGNPNNNINGWTDTATENTIWMATSTCKNGKWSDWSIVRIKGERGEDGTSVKVLGRYGTYEELIKNYNEKQLVNGKEEYNHPNGPQIGDAYIISVVNVDEDGEWVNPYDKVMDGSFPYEANIVNPTDPTKDSQFIMRGVLFSWDGDSWVFLGKFQGDGAYVHVKYSPNPDVAKIEWMVNEKGEHVIVPGTELTNFPTQDLWEVPVNIKTGQKAKYMGMYTDNEVKDSNDVNRYKWSKFIGEDGFGYEYIYIRTKNEQVPTIPAEKKPVRTDYNTDAEYEEAYKEYHTNGHMPVQPEDWKEDFWWTDEPSGVDEDYPYEWMAWRIWQQGIDEWSEWRGSNKKDENTGLPLAVLHTVWTNAGFTSFAFTRTNMDLSGWDMKDVTGTYKTPLPIMKDEDGIVDSDDIVGKTEYNGSTIIWSDSVPAPSVDNPYEIVWMTSAKFNLSMDGMNNHPQWSTPREMTDTSDLDVDWCPYGPETDPAITDPGNPDDNPNLWWETPYVGKANDGKTDWPAKIIDGESKHLDPVWMATRKLKNGEPIKGESWVITRVKGEKGDPGTDGTSISIKGRYKYFMNPDDKDNSLYYNYLGPDGMDFNNGKYDGTLSGNNPPQEYDTYLIELNNNDTNCGEYYTYIKEYEMLDENGDQLWISWMNVGKLKGDPGAPTYTHIKYCPDADILNRPIKPEGGETQEYHEAVKAYNEKFKDLLWEVPVKKTDKGSINAKYLGICNNNNIEDPVDAFEYTWSKFGGDDGFGYEYIYMRNDDPIAPPVPATSSPEDGVLPTKPKDWNKETWWTDIMTGVDSENKYEWMCWRKKSTNVDGIYAWGPWLGSEGKSAPNGVASLINYFSEKEYSTICALDVEPVTIKIDKFGKYSSESINVKVFTKKGDEKYLYEGENGTKVPPGYKVKAYYKVEDNKVIEEDITESLTFDVVNKKPIDNIVNIGLYQNDMQLDFESIPILEDEDNIIADLSNDRYAITCNNFGSPVNSSEIVETEFKLYYGLDDVELHTVTVSYEGSSITIDGNSKESEKDMNGCSASLKFNEDMKSAILTVTEFDESAPLAMNFKFEADAIIKGEHRTGTAIFIINKVIPGGKTPTLYQMIPSATTITQSKTGSNTPTSISVKVVKIEGTTDESQSKTTVLNNLDEGLSIVAYKDGNYGDKIDLSYSNGSSTVVATGNIAERLEFRLIHQNEDKSYGEIHDLYIPVIKEGQDGITPTIYQIKPDVTTIRVSGTESNPQYAVGTINFDLMKVSGNQITNLSGDGAFKEGTWKYGIDRAEVDETFSNSLNINTLKPKTMITVDFWKNNEKLDRVMIPVVTDGAAGETTTVYSLHASSGTIKYDKNGVGYPQSLSASVLYTAGNRIESLSGQVGNIRLYAVLDKGSIEVYLNDQKTEFDGSRLETTKSIPYGTNINGWSSSDESVKFYLYKDGVLIDKETIPILVDGKDGKDGEDGESAAVANLTNDMIAIQCDADGKPISTSSYTTTFELYHGTEKLTLNNLVAAPSTNPTVEVDYRSGLVTISKYSNMSDTVEITITGTANDNGTSISLSKVLKVVKVKKGEKGDPGGPGEKGKNGALARNLGKWSEIPDNTHILSGSKDENYIDFVVDFVPDPDDKDGNKPPIPIAYQCLKSHVKEGNKYPPKGGENSSEYWLESDSFKFVSTQLLNADQIVADVIQNNHSIVTDVVGDSGSWTGNEINGSDKVYTKVVTENGIIEFYYSKTKLDVESAGWVKAVDIGYDFISGNCGMLRFYDSSGNVLYNLGPKGLTAVLTKSPSATVSPIYTGRGYNFFNIGDTNYYPTIMYDEIYGTAARYDINTATINELLSESLSDFYNAGLPTLKLYGAYSKSGNSSFINDNIYKCKRIDPGTFAAQWSLPFITYISDSSASDNTGKLAVDFKNFPSAETPDSGIMCGPNTIGFMGFSTSELSSNGLSGKIKDLTFHNISFDFIDGELNSNSNGTLTAPQRFIDVCIPSPTGIHEFSMPSYYDPGQFYMSTGPYSNPDSDSPYKSSTISDQSSGYVMLNTSCPWSDILNINASTLDKLIDDGRININFPEGEAELFGSEECKKSIINSLDCMREIVYQVVENWRVEINNGTKTIISSVSNCASYASNTGTYPELIMGIELFNIFSCSRFDINEEIALGYLFPANKEFIIGSNNNITSNGYNTLYKLSDLYGREEYYSSYNGQLNTSACQNVYGVHVKTNAASILKGYMFISTIASSIGSKQIPYRDSKGNLGFNNAYVVTIKPTNNSCSSFNINCYPINAYAGIMSNASLSKVINSYSNTLTNINSWLSK